MTEAQPGGAVLVVEVAGVAVVHTVFAVAEMTGLPVEFGSVVGISDAFAMLEPCRVNSTVAPAKLVPKHFVRTAFSPAQRTVGTIRPAAGSAKLNVNTLLITAGCVLIVPVKLPEIVPEPGPVGHS